MNNTFSPTRLFSTGIFLFIAISCFCFLPKTALAFSGSGAGTSAEDPYLITTCAQLQEMNDALGAYYKLSNDIDCSATTTWNEDSGNPGTYFGFVPTGWDGNNGSLFSGALNGNNKVIIGLYINRNMNWGAGLIVYSNGSISDVGLVSANITNLGGDAGGLVGSMGGGTITNSHVTGSISGSQNAGGLVGNISGGNISASYSTASITGGNQVGGLIGYDSGAIITTSYAIGSVTVTGGQAGGGLVGFKSAGSISNSYATGNVSAGYAGGGLVGSMYGATVLNSYATGNVTATTVAGGVVGVGSEGSCTNSFWDTEVHSLSQSACGATGKTTIAMKGIGTYTTIADGLTTAWDFIGTLGDDVGTNDYWDIEANSNNGYPYLSWQTFSTGSAVPEFSTYVLFSTLLIGGWMVQRKMVEHKN